MKALTYITVLALLALMSCTSGLYSGVENDDLYFQASDQAIARTKTPSNRQITEGNLKSQDYYNNIYAADTLVSDEYTDAIDSENAIYQQNNYNYYDDFSYSGRLRNFYGNYFDPYWRDPFYSGFGYPYLSYGMYGYPYSSYNPYYYDPFYSDYGYYGGYSPYYSGYYGGYFGFSSFYNYPYYYNNYYTYRYDDGNNAQYGRRERQSNYSSGWNNRMPVSASGRRDGYLSKGTSSDLARRSAPSSSVTSRTAPSSTNTRSQQEVTKSANPQTRTVDVKSQSATRPSYNSIERTYTPSYNNPRMSTRPSYNNSRTNTQAGTPGAGTYPNSTNRSSSYPSTQTRTAPSNSNAKSYSAPARRTESSSTYTPRSYNSSSTTTRSSYSSGSESRSSSSGSSGGSYSSGSSSSGSSRSSSGGGSAGGRR
jgi:hypothetical protein